MCSVAWCHRRRDLLIIQHVAYCDQNEVNARDPIVKPLRSDTPPPLRVPSGANSIVHRWKQESEDCCKPLSPDSFGAFLC